MYRSTPFLPDNKCTKVGEEGKGCRSKVLVLELARKLLCFVNNRAGKIGIWGTGGRHVELGAKIPSNPDLSNQQCLCKAMGKTHHSSGNESQSAGYGNCHIY